MIYPTINQYIDTLSAAEQFTKSLVGVEFITTSTGDFVYCSGNYGVVFKVRQSGVTFALKCFTRSQSGRVEAYARLCGELPESPYLLGVEWLAGELMVAPYGSDQLSPFDAVRMEYVEGVTLTCAVERAARIGDRGTLAQLSERFDRLALWLLDQSFAHGDLKPENIMVTGEGSLRLVDYDGIYLPSMEGEEQREAGTVAFQHPLRSTMKFCKSIDDYSIALISLSLRALAREPELLGRAVCGRGELIVHPADAVGGLSSMLDYIEMSNLVDRDLVECVRSASPAICGLASILSAKSDSRSEKGEFYPFQGERGWGFVARDGGVVVAPFYDEVRSFCEDLAAVCLNGKWGFIDTKGEVVVPIRYDRAWDFTTEGVALVRLDDRYGFVGQRGRIAIKLQFDYAASFSEGLAVAAIGGKYGYIDSRGTWAVAAQYRYARSLRGGAAQVELPDGVVTTIYPLRDS